MLILKGGVLCAYLLNVRRRHRILTAVQFYCSLGTIIA